MEAHSLTLVALSLLLAAWGAWDLLFVWLYRRGTSSINQCIYILLFALGPLFDVWNQTAESRWMGAKVSLFVGTVYFAVRHPRIASAFVIGIALVAFANNVATGMVGTKYGLFPYLLIVSAITVHFARSRSVYMLAGLGIVLSASQAWALEVRTVAVQLLFFSLALMSRKGAAILVRYGGWVPVLGIVAMLATFAILNSFPDLPEQFYSSSNIERSAMTAAAIRYLAGGVVGGATFDDRVASLMEMFSLTPYYSAKGVDPHEFFLSVWRDLGLAFTVLCFATWLRFWKAFRIRMRGGSLNTVCGRVPLAALMVAVTLVSLSPPSTEERLFVALLLGIGYATAGLTRSGNYSTSFYGLFRGPQPLAVQDRTHSRAAADQGP